MTNLAARKNFSKSCWTQETTKKSLIISKTATDPKKTFRYYKSPKIDLKWCASKVSGFQSLKVSRFQGIGYLEVSMSPGLNVLRCQSPKVSMPQRLRPLCLNVSRSQLSRSQCSRYDVVCGCLNMCIDTLRQSETIWGCLWSNLKNLTRPISL